jgi:CubicO group peptidase (beta-lactamase class C family)
VLASIFLAPGLLNAQAKQTLPTTARGQDPQVIAASVTAEMRRDHIPDVALSIFTNGKPQSFYFSIGRKQVLPGAVFEAASLGKPVFAAAVLAFAAEGKIDLDRPLVSYLRGDYAHEQNPFGQGPSEVVKDPLLRKVTARMVLDHTSGLPNWARGPLSFASKPGEKWSYSGEGYLFLQRVIESISGQDLQSFVSKRVFGPLGMTSSSYIWRPEYAQLIVTPHAKDGAERLPDHYAHGVAASTLYTTLDDYDRFLAALYSPTSNSAYTRMQSPQVTVSAAIKLDWGLGLAIEAGPQPCYFHWGANPGYQSFFMIEPSIGEGVLFFTGSDNGLELVDFMTAQFLSGNHPALKFPMLHPKD